MSTHHATPDTFSALEATAAVGDEITVDEHPYRYVIDREPGDHLVGHLSTGEPVYTTSRGTWY